MNYEKLLNPRVTSIPPSGIRRFFDLASEMEDCISLGVGEPDFVTPWDIRDAAIKSLQAGKTQYTSNAGLISLREQIAGYVYRRFALSYQPKSEIIVTVGASEAIDLALRTLVSEGEEVLIPAPSYVSYRPNVTLVGGVAVEVNLSGENGFKLTADALKKAITPKSKVLIFPYPNNPTGAIMTKEEMQEIVDVIVKNNLLVISDEIYAELTYTKEGHVSIASLEGMKERTVVINGFSKAFAMTGWRLGYMCAPHEIIEQAYKIHQYTIMCANTFAQYGAEIALTSGAEDEYETVRKMRESYDMRRRYLYNELNKMGLTCYMPQGAFYIFPCVKVTGLTGERFAQKLLVEKHVAVVPGNAFGSAGEYYVRCCYATSLADLKTAVSRIREFMEENGWLK